MAGRTIEWIILLYDLLKLLINRFQNVFEIHHKQPEGLEC